MQRTTLIADLKIEVHVNDFIGTPVPIYSLIIQAANCDNRVGGIILINLGPDCACVKKQKG